KGVIGGDYSLPVVVQTLATSTLTATLPVGSITEAGVTNGYQWYRAGVAVVGATGASYVLTAADLGKSISVKWTVSKLHYKTISLTVTATEQGFLSSVTTSFGTSPVLRGILEGTFEAPSVVEGPDDLLTVVVPADCIAGDGVVLTYQWYRNGSPIVFATGST